MRRVLNEVRKRNILDNETASISTRRVTVVTLKPVMEHNIVNFSTPPLKVEAAPAEPPDTSTNHWYIWRTEYEIGSHIAAVINSAGAIPDYFGVEVRVAGRRLTKSMPDLHLWERVPYAGKPGGIRRQESSEVSTNLLASAARRVQGKELLAVNVLLTSRSVLFERQTTRSFWIGTLIGVSALAALSGLAAAWRAFQRQIQLTEMKSQFVSSVSHELRAPIASVRLLAESLERGKIQQPEKQNEYFRFIGQECRRLSALIENVLDFSRIDQGRKQYELEPTDLMGLVEQTVRLMETYAAEKQVKLALTLSDEVSQARPQPNVDGKAMQQALVNLVDNAIKHSAPGQTVTIGLERDKEELRGPLNDVISKPRWMLWVADAGPGIPREEQEKIFERFYRCGSELRRETQGVGIGLSIVKHIVESHGGRVLVDSVVGQGSRFTISLPAASDSA
jgi:signal transduction histidine kinase